MKAMEINKVQFSCQSHPALSPQTMSAKPLSPDPEYRFQPHPKEIMNLHHSQPRQSIFGFGVNHFPALGFGNRSESVQHDVPNQLVISHSLRRICSLGAGQTPLFRTTKLVSVAEVGWDDECVPSPSIDHDIAPIPIHL